jgi:hypothetical protein
MKKWIGPFVSVLLVIVLVHFLAPFQPPVPRESANPGIRPVPAIFGRMDDEDQKKEGDSHLVQVLRRVQEVLDGWLKSLNERIESEDITRLEVRFLEVLRSVLEWVKAKVDAKIESSKGQKGGRTTLLEIERSPWPRLMRG